MKNTKLLFILKCVILVPLALSNAFVLIHKVPAPYSHSVAVAQWLEHCTSSTKVVGSIPREHMY